MKRSLDEVAQHSKKRRRTEPKTKGKVKPQLDAVVSIDQLTWNEVTLPDRFDDAEGFFGLQEIEDVEVVKDVGSGSVLYKVCRHPYCCRALIILTLLAFVPKLDERRKEPSARCIKSGRS